MLSAPTPAPDPVSVVSSVGNAAEGRVSGTLQDVSSLVDAGRTGAEPVPSLVGTTDVPADGVSPTVYSAFEELVVSPPETIDVAGVAATTDAFSTPGVDGGVPGVTFGRLGSAPAPQLLRVIR
jgi:hypothetical protein